MAVSTVPPPVKNSMGIVHYRKVKARTEVLKLLESISPPYIFMAFLLWSMVVSRAWEPSMK